MVFLCFSDKEYAGITHEESPECTPASSMCCMIPPINTLSPSQTASTSNSYASSKNLSIKIGCSPETSVACFTNLVKPSSS